MSNVLVSLVSDQVIPNVLFIKEMDRIKTDVQMYLFISTELMEKKEKTGCIIRGSHVDKSKNKTIEVVEDSIEDINSRLTEFAKELSDEDDMIVNLTGGTKIMSIGVYNFFKERNANIYYLPIGKNTYKQIFPSLTENEHPLEFRISLKDYLTSYGINIISTHINNTLKPKEYTEKFFRNFLDNKFDIKVIDKLRGKRNKNTPIDEETMTFIEKFDFHTEENDFLNGEEIKYLTGGWFEEYTYNLINEKLQLNKNELGLDIQISHEDTPNQFDVMFVYENTLYVVECKTSLSKDMLIRTLYKLSALKKNYGLSVKSYVFTLDKKLRSLSGDIKEDYANRASLLGIRLIDGMMLTDEKKLNEIFNGIKGGTKDV